MANIILTSNAQFQPFSYQELAVPIMHQQQVHDAVAEEYDKLSSQADVLEAMAMRDGDSEAYRRYKAFSDSLRNAADRLYSHGLDSQTKLTMHGLKRAYNTEIVPIQNAWTKRSMEQKMQQDAYLKDPSLMFSRNAGDTSLDWYMSNPEGGFKVVSGNNIRAGVMAAAKNLQKKLLTDPKEAIKLQKDDPQLYYSITRYGLDVNDVENWQNHPALKKIVDDVLKANGVNKDVLGDSYQDIYNQSIGHAGLGVWDAVGEDKVEFETPPTSSSKSRSGSGSGSGEGSDMSPFPLMMQDMPLIMADKDTKEKSEKYATALGFGKAGGNGKMAESITAKSLFDNKGGSAIKPTNYSPISERPTGRGVNNARVFDKKTKKLLTREEFVKQAGDSESARANYGNWYDNNVIPALEYFGFGVGSTPTAGELEGAYKRRYDNASAGTISGLDITHSDAEDWRKMGSSNAYPVKGYNRETGMQAASQATTLGQLLDEVKDSDSNAHINSTILTNYQGSKALMFNVQRGDKTTPYIVPLDTGNSAIAGATSLLDKAEECQKLYQKNMILCEDALKKGMREEAERYYEAAEKAKSNAENLYGQGLTYLNNSQGVYSRPSIPTWSKPTDKQLGYGE